VIAETKAQMSTARAVAIMVLISVALCAVTYALGLTKERSDGQRRVCDLIAAQISVAAPKSDPRLHPGRYELYVAHQHFSRLAVLYHCNLGS
jgi:hypothetical protein